MSGEPQNGRSTKFWRSKRAARASKNTSNRVPKTLAARKMPYLKNISIKKCWIGDASGWKSALELHIGASGKAKSSDFVKDILQNPENAKREDQVSTKSQNTPSNTAIYGPIWTCKRLQNRPVGPCRCGYKRTIQNLPESKQDRLLPITKSI